MNGMQRMSLDRKWSTVISFDTFNESSHHGQRFDDPSHRTALDRSVTGESACKILSCKNTGNQTGSCTAVAGIQYFRRSRKTMQSFSVNQDFLSVIFYLNAQFAETGNSGKAVGSLQKIGNSCSPFCKCTEHDRTMGNRFISWYGNFTTQWMYCFLNFHN